VVTILAEHGLIGIFASGAAPSHIAVDRCKELDVWVGAVGAYSPESIAGLALAQLLRMLHSLDTIEDRMTRGDFSLLPTPPGTLIEKSVGIIGYGAIGQAFHRMCSSFKCKVAALDWQAADTHVPTHPHFHKETSDPAQVPRVSLPAMLATSDVVFISCLESDRTRGLLSREMLSLCKPGCVLVNVARGSIIDTDALIDRLDTGALRCVLDVYDGEVGLFFRDHQGMEGVAQRDARFARLYSHKGCMVTPHCSWWTEPALSNIGSGTYQRIRDILIAKGLME
ncbi:hypothetical protein KIPB_007811, partial [Kipferlia bialata]